MAVARKHNAWLGFSLLEVHVLMLGKVTHEAQMLTVIRHTCHCNDPQVPIQPGLCG